MQLHQVETGMLQFLHRFQVLESMSSRRLLLPLAGNERIREGFLF
ncbi:hypothetical protein SLEP1_g21199 [Rubroshorea leprosula]|uniref:Uncharacterized protein n=1 Tax=Rubroshorea leprosula TaxID=152421 RepID=A0AAV5J8D6_9ROSI|nr:hypothetical protein SLEP1_g21199 [Rubroshorea leprosula]